MTHLDRAIAAARITRAELLRDPRRPRNLHGQCGLASILIAVAIGDPRSLRLGFFMKRTTFLGQRGRYPHVHAWDVVDGTIVDATATQFGHYPAVHVASMESLHAYGETADGAQALREMVEDRLHDVDGCRWRLRRRRLPALVQWRRPRVQSGGVPGRAARDPDDRRQVLVRAMKINLTESEILTIREALKVAPSARNYDSSYLSAFKALLARFESLAHDTRYERGRRRALACAIHLVPRKEIR